ncbi:MAG: hypothetical protein LH660_18830 [Phormidesmis sp. CAN_BIN36]|nr:hypothetical protein [Phormidesmis sp. CAN_BIN36]
MVKILYIIQTFKAPEQIQRLVQVIKRSSPSSEIIISHDYTVSDLDIEPLQSLGAQVLKLNGKGGRGDFSMLQGYLDAIEWAYDHQIKFDWVINLSGQDYPTQPLPVIEQLLELTHYDGFLSYFEAFSDAKENPWGSREGHNRYSYQYWRSGLVIPKPTLQSKVLGRLEWAIERLQPFLRVFSIYDCLMVGANAQLPIFNQKFLCYGGSYYHALSSRCVRYLYDFSQENPKIVEYYRRTVCPNESFVQTILINSGLFDFCDDCKRYLDFDSADDSSRPRTLNVKDYPILIQDNIHFARKFEPAQDSKILDLLDARILQRP